MRVTVVFPDAVVIVDGVVASGVDLGAFDENWRALQWLGEVGWIETRAGDNIPLSSISEVQPYIDLHAAAVALPAPPPVTQQTLTDYASEKRWLVEIGGCLWNGIPIPTDDRAKLLILGAAQTLGDEDQAPLVIGGVNYGTISGAQFRAINVAVIVHVQTTFAKLAQVLAAIGAGTVTTYEQIDNWPWTA